MATLADLEAAYDAQLGALLGWLRALPVHAEDEPTRLDAWTIRQLAFHTTQVPRAFNYALSKPELTDKPLSIAGYTARWRDSASEIAGREQDGAAGLAMADIIDSHLAEAAAMHAALARAAGDPVVASRRGPIRASDFMVTRVNELVVHSLDLSASLPDLEPVSLDNRALAISSRMLTGILAERVPGHTVEVRVPPYSAIQCVEGPRHTRGTPANVVEADAVSWVELATGRLSWTDAVRMGRVRASGERADISEHLPVLS
jgi:uncharacterized protein (TIGR03083 family)